MEKNKIHASIAGLESVAVRGARKKRALREEQVLSRRQAVRKVRAVAQITEWLYPIPPKGRRIENCMLIQPLSQHNQFL